MIVVNGTPGGYWATPAGSRDGCGAGDHNEEYVFGETQTARRHPRFTEREFARLLCLRSHIQDGDRLPESSVLEAPERYGLAESALIVPKQAPACFDDNCNTCQAFLRQIEAP